MMWWFLICLNLIHTHSSKYWTVCFAFSTIWPMVKCGGHSLSPYRLHWSHPWRRRWLLLLLLLLRCAILCRVNVRYRYQANKALLRLTLTHQMMTADGARTRPSTKRQKTDMSERSQDPHLVVSLFIISSQLYVQRAIPPEDLRLRGSSESLLTSSFFVTCLFYTSASNVDCTKHNFQLSFVRWTNLRTFFPMIKVCSGNNFSVGRTIGLCAL